MLYLTLDKKLPKSDGVITDVLETAGEELRSGSLYKAKDAHLSISASWCKDKSPDSFTKKTPLTENQSKELEAGECVFPPLLVSCAMVAVYTAENNTVTGVLAYHAPGGEISNDSPILCTGDKPDKILLYAVTSYDDDYDKYIEKLLAAGYKTENICIVTGISKTVFLGYDGSVMFC